MENKIKLSLPDEYEYDSSDEEVGGMWVDVQVGVRVGVRVGVWVGA